MGGPHLRYVVGRPSVDADVAQDLRQALAAWDAGAGTAGLPRMILLAGSGHQLFVGSDSTQNRKP